MMEIRSSTTMTGQVRYIGWSGTGHITVVLPSGVAFDMPDKVALVSFEGPGPIRVHNRDYQPPGQHGFRAHVRNHGFVIVFDDSGGWEVTPLTADDEGLTL